MFVHCVEPLSAIGSSLPVATSIYNLASVQERRVYVSGKLSAYRLFCVDLKVLFKTLVLKLQVVLSKLIRSDQEAFVERRSMHHSVRFPSDLQDLVTDLEAEAYAAFLDFEKV